MSCYADDFAAVLDAVAPGEQVHVLAHDWGSAGMWEYLARSEARDRVASFTSLSGPSADHVNRFIMGSLKRPYQPRRFAQALGQLARLSYMGGFSVPVLGPMAVRRFFADYVTSILKTRDGIPAEQVYHSQTYKSDAANSLKVYRANYFRTPRFRQDRPLRRRARPGDRQHERSVRAPVRLRRHPQVGAATVAPRHPGRPLVADVAPLDDRAVGTRTGRLPRGQASEPVATARAGRPPP